MAFGQIAYPPDEEYAKNILEFLLILFLNS